MVTERSSSVDYNGCLLAQVPFPALFLFPQNQRDSGPWDYFPDPFSGVSLVAFSLVIKYAHVDLGESRDLNHSHQAMIMAADMQMQGSALIGQTQSSEQIHSRSNRQTRAGVTRLTAPGGHHQLTSVFSPFFYQHCEHRPAWMQCRLLELPVQFVFLTDPC